MSISTAGGSFGNDYMKSNLKDTVTAILHELSPTLGVKFNISETTSTGVVSSTGLATYTYTIGFFST